MNHKHSKKCYPRYRNESAATMLEFVLIVPVLLLMILFFFDIGRAYYHKNTYAAAAQTALNYAAVIPNLEDVDLSKLDESELIEEIKQRAVSYLEGLGMEYKPGVWSSDALEGEASPDSAPAWAWINAVNVELPAPGEGESLKDALAERTIKIEVEAFLMNVTPFMGPKRLLVEAIGYRELSQTPTDPKDYDCETEPGGCPCPNESNPNLRFSGGKCACRQDVPGLDPDTCACSIADQNYNAETDSCVCPPPPDNSVLLDSPDSCIYACNPNWGSGGGNGDGTDCSTCSPPFKDLGDGKCDCEHTQAECNATGGTFNSETCECKPCGADGSNYDTSGNSCECKDSNSTGECGENQIRDPNDNCACKCANENLVMVDDKCVCNVNTVECGSGDPGNEWTYTIDPETCTCIDCPPGQQSDPAGDRGTCGCPECPEGEFRWGSGSISDVCAPCQSCSDWEGYDSSGSPVPGAWQPNPAGGPSAPCKCDLECQENEYLRDCSCVKCTGGFEVDASGSGCTCPPERKTECVAAMEIFDPVTCTCGSTCNPTSALPDYDPVNATCSCDSATRIAGCVAQGLAFDAANCKCGAPCLPLTGTPDLNSTTGQCTCDVATRKAECDSEGKEWKAATCSCGNKCGSDFNLSAAGVCECNVSSHPAQAARKAQCLADGYTWDNANCRCGSRCGDNPATPDLSADGSSCQCRKTPARVAACALTGRPFDTSTCACGVACEGFMVLNPIQGACQCGSALKPYCASLGKKINTDNGKCECGQECAPNSAFPDVSSNGKSCICDPNNKDRKANTRQECFDQGRPWINCACGAACSGGTPNLNTSTGACECNITTLKASCTAQGKPILASGGKCECGPACSGSTPDVSTGGACVCNRSWANADGKGNSCPAGQEFNAATCSCQPCSSGRVWNPTTHVCDCSECPPTQVRTGSSCACACPSGTSQSSIFGSSLCVPNWCTDSLTGCSYDPDSGEFKIGGRRE